MKVLEINGFMTWARNYEGDHEVIRWMARQKGGADGGGPERRSWWRDVLRGLGLLREIREMELDLIVCAAFGRAYGAGPWRRRIKAFHEGILIRLVVAMRRKSGVPLAVVDIADDHTVHPVNRGLLEGADRYFKRELPLDPYHALESLRGGRSRRSTRKDRLQAERDGWVAKLRPIPLGCRQVERSGARTAAAEKRWDVFYVGSEEVKPRRAGVEAAVRELGKRGYAVCVPEEALELEDYLDALAASRLALSPPGLGWDCHRHYEAALLGTVVVTPFPTVQRHQPLLNGEHCLFYDPEKNLADQLEEMLKDAGRLDGIAGRAQEHARKHHTHRAIFGSMLERATMKTTTESHE